MKRKQFGKGICERKEDPLKFKINTERRDKKKSSEEIKKKKLRTLAILKQH